MLKGEKVILRGYEEKDVETAHRLFNDYELQSLTCPRMILPNTLAEEKKFLESLSADKDKKFGFAIETLKDSRYIGGCSYFNLDWRSRTTWVGIAIADKDFWGQGYGADAMKVLCTYLFDELNLRKVILAVFAFNQRAIECYTKLGFVEEGRLREQIYREGTYHDEILMSRFRDGAGPAPAMRKIRQLKAS